MKKTQQRIQIAIGLLNLMAFSFACAAEDSVHIRTLAASCAVCHGGLGNPVEAAATQKSLQLAGMARDKFVERLANFKSGKTTSTVMHHHAKGLTEVEINALADFFSAQTPQTRAAVPSQTYQSPTLE